MSYQLRTIVRGFQGYHEPEDAHWHDDATPISTAEQMSYSRVQLDAQDLAKDQDSHERRSKSLYVSHFLSTWNSRGFEFGAVLFLSKIYPGTLLPLSVYALCRSLAAIVLSPVIGNHIDHSNRLGLIRLSILGQRLAVAISCVAFFVLLLFIDKLSVLLQHALFVGLIIMAVVEKLSIIMNTIAIERDWVVVIAENDESVLQEMNAQMRRIDLFCKLVSPLAVALLDGWSSVFAVACTLGINGVSILAEYFLIAWVYRSTPELARTSPQEQGETEPSVRSLRSASLLLQPLSQLKAYSESHAFLPSFSLSLLYLTVLSFSGQMVTYLFTLQQPHFTSIDIGILRTIATVLEISATFLAPVLINRLGAVRAGIWSLSWQCLFLTPGVFLFWVELNSPALTTCLLITSVIFSRICLWSFDLTAQLQVQNSIDASQRGSFSATESSLQNFFELCAFAMTIVWSRPEQFRYPATISLGAVYIAAGCYARYVRKERGHLLHVPCCESACKSKNNDDEDGVELINESR